MRNIIPELDLPFGSHTCPGDHRPGHNERAVALVFTTEPDLTYPNERCQCDVVAVVEADNADLHGDRASELASFITEALNAYVQTPQGLDRWKKVHPLMEVMRTAGRQ